MSKRPSISEDLLKLTSGDAAPMPEAIQRQAKAAPAAKLPKSITDAASVRTENLEGLSFKVSPAFRKRFKQRAVNADLMLNELLFDALDAWEEKHGLKS